MSSKGTRRPRAAKDAAEDTEAPVKNEDAKPAKRAKASSNNIGLPSWKGPYICYCGVDAAGKSTGEIIDFPQFCLCTDVSGRAACALCKEKIAKGCARVGVQSRRFNNSVFAKCKWYHPACFAENVEGFVSVQQIEMWDSAGAEVRKEIIDHAPKGVDVEGKKKESHAHTAECLDCREKGTHPSIEASKKKGKTDAEEEEEEAPAKEEDDDADAAEEEEEKKPAAKKGKAKKEDKKPAAEKKKGKKAAAAEPESDEEAAADGAEDEDGDTDMKAADGGLPAWKGAFICYCGTTDSGHSVREEKVAFPQVCICTDVSGRASCKECKKPIMRGSARIGVQTGKFSHTGQGSCGWFHPGCFARNPPTKFQHVNQIEQFELAPDDVKKEISRNLPPAASAPSKSAPGPRDHSATCKEARAKGAHRVTLARRENVKAAAKKE